MEEKRGRLAGNTAAEGSFVLHFLAEEEDQDLRIDQYLAGCCGQLSRSYLQKLMKTGAVLVNERPVKASYKLNEGDRIFCHVPEAVEPEILAEPMDLEILYEDKDVIFINKPKGMVVHPAPGHISGTLVNGLLYHCRGELSGINGVMRPGIVHRIDKDTTGVIVACKNDSAHRALAGQLKEHSITRRYYAIVHGGFSGEEGTVDAPIGRHPVDRKKMSINEKNGKPAVTHYRVLERLGNFTWIECRLETGRTHQIRVHMASIKHPLLGDEVYGPGNCPVKHLQGQTLHAGVLGVIHPSTGEYLEVTAPLPKYFTGLLEMFRKV